MAKNKNQSTNGNMKKEYFVFLVSLIVIIIDQLAKYFAKGINIAIIDNFFYLKYTTNTGAAFGILKDYNLALIFFSIIILGIVLFYFDKIPNKRYVLFSVGLFTGGLLGNLIDRIAHGYVNDFIFFTIWPSFNIADISICFGVFGLIIWLWKE